MPHNNNTEISLRSPIADNAHMSEAPLARADFTAVIALINKNRSLIINNEWLARLVLRLEDLTQQLLTHKGLEPDSLPTVTRALLSLLETMINSLKNYDEGPQFGDVNHAAMEFLQHYRAVDIPPFCSEHQSNILALNFLVALIFFVLILNSMCGFLSSSPADREKSRDDSALTLKISSPIMAMQFLYIVNMYFSWRKYIKTCQPVKACNELRQQVADIVAAYKNYCKPYKNANYFEKNLDKCPANFRELAAKFYASLPQRSDESQLAILTEFSQSTTPDGEKFQHLLKEGSDIEINEFLEDFLCIPVITRLSFTLASNQIVSFDAYTFKQVYMDYLRSSLNFRHSSVTNPVFDHSNYHNSGNHEKQVTSQGMFFYRANNEQRHFDCVAAGVSR